MISTWDAPLSSLQIIAWLPSRTKSSRRQFFHRRRLAVPRVEVVWLRAQGDHALHGEAIFIRLLVWTWSHI